MKNWIKEHKKAAIVIAVLVIAVIAIAVCVAVLQRSRGSQGQTQQETATVERRTLAESVSATGTFQASDEVNVSSDTMNTQVLQVNVAVGDTVNAGDVICVLDTQDLQEQLADARQNYNDAQNQSGRNVDSARRNLEQAQKDRDESLANVDPDISDAYNDWQEAVTRYNELQAQYNAAVTERDSLKAQIDAGDNSLYQAYVSAQANVNTLKAQMDAAKTTADQSERTYRNLADNRENTIQRINDTYQNQLDAYNTTVENSSTSGEMYADQIEQLEEQIAAATVTAPIRGMVTSLNVEAGDDYNGGTIAAVKNVDAFEVTTEIDEYDINKIQAGQAVVIRTNATGDLELSGTVTEIAPTASGSGSILESGSGSGSSGMGSFDISSLMGGSYSNGSSSGEVTYTVRIAVTTPCDQLKIGMTAKLSIILQQNEDVLSVPFNALQENDDGTYYIEAVTGTNEDGTLATEKITVTRGLESDYYVEVIGDDVKEGMEIVVPQAEGGNTLEDLINSSGAMGGV